MYRAVPDRGDATLAKVNGAMAEKYGLADALWGRLSDRSRAVPIRLERLDAADELAGADRNSD